MPEASRGHFNFSAGAIAQLRRSWSLLPTGRLARQRYLTGPLLSVADAVQDAVNREALGGARLDGSIFVVGHWRSGTTLLHDLLACDSRFTFPSTAACMNPQTFLLNRGSGGTASVSRPMDGMEVRADAPQEDEFALMALGARSPYEALLVPDRLGEALALAHPENLSPPEQVIWSRIFLKFLRGVSLAGGNRPVIAKSPPHACRIGQIASLVPNARFIAITRNPLMTFESSVRMWESMCALYALEPVPSTDTIRKAVFSGYAQFDAAIEQGLSAVAPSNVARLRYEDLVEDALGCVARVYQTLGLDMTGAARASMNELLAARSAYQAANHLPPAPWPTRIMTEWRHVFARHGYAKD